MENRTLLSTDAYVARQTGCDNAKAREKLWIGQKAAYPFLPEEFLEEMKGIADGVKAKGVSNVSLDQLLVNEIEDIATIQNWQESLRDPYNFYVQAPIRFERYRQLLHDYYGNITKDNAIKIMSDHFDPYTNMEKPKDDSSVSNNILCTICAKYPNTVFKAEEPVGTFRAHVANMWSMIAYPETGKFWLTINDFPAQYGGYEGFNFN